MDKIESLNHTKWDCKYHVVFIPKNRRRVVYGQLRMHLGEVFRGLAQHKESRIEEGHLMADHVHMMISIPPKYAVSTVGRDEDVIRNYIRHQEKEDERLEQLGLWR
jgi:putative transposase